MKLLLSLLCAVVFGTSSVAGSSHPIEPDVTPLNYTHMDIELQGFYAMPEGMPPASGFKGVVIIPDWDGVNFYEQVRATLVAEDWGYAAFAADIYGKDLHEVPDLQQRGQLATFYRENPEIFAERIKAAIDEFSALPGVDGDNIVVMGYCFGGTGVLQYSLLGYTNVKGIISFHGGLPFVLGTEPDVDDANEMLPKVLVLSGGDDDAGSDIVSLEEKLNGISNTWEITRYSGIEHAFTVWDDDRYNAFVDASSWGSSLHFVHEVFEEISFSSTEPEMFMVDAVDYEDTISDVQLRGYLAIPDESWQRPLPGVVLVPDWDGANTYEKKRATMLAEQGYVAMVADIFGADKQENLTIPERIEETTFYNSNPDVFLRRMQLAIDQLKGVEDVNGEAVSLAGYCFGGAGILLYAASGSSDVKVCTAFHGSFGSLPPYTDDINTYVQIFAGGNDGLHGDPTVLEAYLDNRTETTGGWEITRYAGLGHGFTSWTSPDYNEIGDARSWDSMYAAFQLVMDAPMKVGSVSASVEPTIMMEMSMAPSMMEMSMAPSMAMDTTPSASPSSSPVEDEMMGPASDDGDDGGLDLGGDDDTDDSSSVPRGVSLFVVALVSAALFLC